MPSTPQQARCSTCGAKLKSGQRFCLKCGADQHPLPILAPVIVERTRRQKLLELGAVLTMFGVMSFVIIRGLFGADEEPIAIPTVVAVNASPAPTAEIVTAQLEIETMPPKTTPDTSASFTYEWTGTEGQFECRLDNEAFAPCDASGQLFVDLAEGIHTFQVRVIRATGEPTNADSYSWTVDSSVPSVAILPESRTFLTPMQIALEPSEPADVFFTLDGSAPTERSQRYRSPIDISSSTTIQAIAIDPAGNRSPVEAAEFVFSPSFSADFEAENLGGWSSIDGMIIEGRTGSSDGQMARVVSTDGARSYAELELAEPVSDFYLQTKFVLLGQGDNPVTLTRLRSEANAEIASLYITSSGRLAVQLAGSTSVTSSVIVPPERWHEVQIHVTVADDRTSVEVWFNGASVRRLNVSTDLNASPVEVIHLGESAEGRVFDVGFDDFTIAPGFIPSAFLIFTEAPASPVPATEASPAATP